MVVSAGPACAPWRPVRPRPRQRCAPGPPWPDTETADEADEIGRRAVLDLAEDETAERLTSPLAAIPTDDAEGDEQSRHRRLLELARAAEALCGHVQRLEGRS